MPLGHAPGTHLAYGFLPRHEEIVAHEESTRSLRYWCRSGCAEAQIASNSPLYLPYSSSHAKSSCPVPAVWRTLRSTDLARGGCCISVRLESVLGDISRLPMDAIINS